LDKELNMKDNFSKFSGYAAIVTGILSILYAIFFLVIARQAEFIGLFGSWVILALSGIFTSAAYVGLYGRMKSASEGFALWGLLLGVASSFATLMHGGYQALLVGQASGAALSEVDPRGLAAFGVVGLVSFIFSWLIVRSGVLAKTFGYLGLFNALLLVVLYFATVAGAQTVILISGGLTAVIVGPIWWIWLGLQLLRDA
jgi:hypothetical protein